MRWREASWLIGVLLVMAVATALTRPNPPRELRSDGLCETEIENRPPSALALSKQLTVDGIALGMTRNEVRKLLGNPMLCFCGPNTSVYDQMRLVVSYQRYQEGSIGEYVMDVAGTVLAQRDHPLVRCGDMATRVLRVLGKPLQRNEHGHWCYFTVSVHFDNKLVDQVAIRAHPSQAPPCHGGRARWGGGPTRNGIPTW